MPHKTTVAKTKEILRPGEVKGQKLTPAQKRYFGARAGGSPIKKK